MTSKDGSFGKWQKNSIDLQPFASMRTEEHAIETTLPQAVNAIRRKHHHLRKSWATRANPSFFLTIVHEDLSIPR